MDAYPQRTKNKKWLQWMMYNLEKMKKIDIED